MYPLYKKVNDVGLWLNGHNGKLVGLGVNSSKVELQYELLGFREIFYSKS